MVSVPRFPRAGQSGDGVRRAPTSLPATLGVSEGAEGRGAPCRDGHRNPHGDGANTSVGRSVASVGAHHAHVLTAGITRV